jgi:hypothetical protein
MKLKKAIIYWIRRIADTKDKELIKKEKAALKFKAMSVDKIFTDTAKNLNEFLEIADSLNTFQKSEIKQIRDTIKLIKKYHVAQLAEVELETETLNNYIKMGRKKTT